MNNRALFIILEPITNLIAVSCTAQWPPIREATSVKSAISLPSTVFVWVIQQKPGLPSALDL